MRKRGCLGCGKIYEGTISICQDCFNTIESIRKDSNYFSRRLKLRNQVICRKIYLWFGIVFISIPIFLLNVKILNMRNITHVFIFLLLTTPLSLLGLFLGHILARMEAANSVKRWSDRKCYNYPFTPEARKTRKYYLHELGITALYLLVLYSVVMVYNFLTFLSPISPIVFDSLIRGLNLLIWFFLGSSAVSSHHLTNWIPKLSK